MNHVDGFLGDGVEGGYGLRVGFKRTLRDDQIGEFGRDIHVRALQPFCAVEETADVWST